MKLLETNKKVLSKIVRESEDVKLINERFKKVTGKDAFGEDSPFLKEGGFSFKKAQAKLNASLRESDAASSFQAVLRAGVQSAVNSSYETVSTTFEDWVTVIQSSKDTELYAPLHGIGFPRQVGPSEKYPQVGAAGLSIQLRNNKYGTMYSLQRELLDDDQTGQFNRQAGLLGEYMKLLTEVLVYAKLASKSSMQYLDYKIPPTETKPSDEAGAYPWNATGLLGGGINRPVAYQAFNQSSVQNGITALMGQKNLLGILMNVNANRLLISPRNTFDASVLANSAYYPTGAVAGATGGAFSINPLKGIFDVTVSRYMFNDLGAVDPNSKAWYLVDDSKPWFIVQMREAAVVEQEAPNAGNSFEMDEIRFKVRSRMNADFIDPRFAWQGNDGSI